MKIARTIQEALENLDDQIIVADMLRQRVCTLILRIEMGVSPEAAIARFQEEIGLNMVPYFKPKKAAA